MDIFIMPSIVTSAASTNLLSPCSMGVHRLALKCNTNSQAKGVEALQYIARPVDSLIQAAALPIFITIDHCKDISKDTSKWKVAKICLSPINLTTKLISGLLASALNIAIGILQLVIPVVAINSVRDGKNGAQDFFAKRKETKENNPEAIDLLDHSKLSPEAQALAEKEASAYNKKLSEFIEKTTSDYDNTKGQVFPSGSAEFAAECVINHFKDANQNKKSFEMEFQEKYKNKFNEVPPPHVTMLANCGYLKIVWEAYPIDHNLTRYFVNNFHKVFPSANLPPLSEDTKHVLIVKQATKGFSHTR